MGGELYVFIRCTFNEHLALAICDSFLLPKVGGLFLLHFRGGPSEAQSGNQPASDSWIVEAHTEAHKSVSGSLTPDCVTPKHIPLPGTSYTPKHCVHVACRWGNGPKDINRDHSGTRGPLQLTHFVSSANSHGPFCCFPNLKFI